MKRLILQQEQVDKKIESSKDFLDVHRYSKRPWVAMMHMILESRVDSERIFQDLGYQVKWQELTEFEEESYWVDVNYLQSPKYKEMTIKELALMSLGINVFPAMYWMCGKTRHNAAIELWDRYTASPYEFGDGFVSMFQWFHKSELGMIPQHYANLKKEGHLRSRPKKLYEENLQDSVLEPWQVKWVDLDRGEKWLYGDEFKSSWKNSNWISSTADTCFVGGKIYSKNSQDTEMVFVEKVVLKAYMSLGQASVVAQEQKMDAGEYLKKHQPAAYDVVEWSMMEEARCFSVTKVQKWREEESFLVLSVGEVYVTLPWVILDLYDYSSIPIPSSLSHVRRLVTWMSKNPAISNVPNNYEEEKKREYMQIDWRRWRGPLKDYEERASEKRREYSAVRLEKKDKQNQKECQKLKKEKEMAGLYDVVNVGKVHLVEILCCLRQIVVSDVVGVFFAILQKLKIRGDVLEHREKEAWNVDGEGKCSVEEKLKESVQKMIGIAENAGFLTSEVPILHFKMTGNTFVLVEGPVSNQVNNYFAIRKPDKGVQAWISREIPQWPVGDVPPLIRIQGMYQEAFLKSGFPLGMDWQDWTIFVLRANTVKKRKSTPQMFVTFYGDDFLCHKDFSFTDKIEGREQESELGKIFWTESGYRFCSNEGVQLELPSMQMVGWQKGSVKRVGKVVRKRKGED